jgi:hypothetical protein
MAGITFYPDDSPLDRRLKTSMLRIYNSKVIWPSAQHNERSLCSALLHTTRAHI